MDEEAGRREGVQLGGWRGGDGGWGMGGHLSDDTGAVMVMRGGTLALVPPLDFKRLGR